MPLRGPLRYSQRSGHLQTLRLELSTPLNRLRRFPLQGTTPAARQSRLRGVPGRGFASLASPRLLVRCAHLAGVGVASFLTPHFSQGHGTPCHYTLQRQRQNPKLRHSARSRGIHVCLHSNLDAATTRSMTTCAGHRCPHHPHHSPSFTPHSSLLTPHSPSLLTPTTSLLTPHASPLNSSANGCAVRAIAFRPPGWGPGSAGIGRAGFWGRLLRRGWIRHRSSG